MEALPIATVRDELLCCIREHPVVVLVGSTGTGKTTQLPQYLLRQGVFQSIACTQPRRVAAISVAKRVADEMAMTLGQEVGYSVRFDDRTSPGKTRIKYLTDGMLLRELMHDENAEQYDVIMVDEAHERSLATDVVLGILRRIVRDRWSSSDVTKAGERTRVLRVIVSSATMNAEFFSSFFDQAPIFRVDGREFPVTTRYAQEMPKDYVQAAVALVLQILFQSPCSKDDKAPNAVIVDDEGTTWYQDMLVFLTGQDEIERAIYLLKGHLQNGTALGSASAVSATADDILLIPLYAALPPEQHSAVFEVPSTRKRKIIFATNVAETSITLPRIRYVIDSGFVKQRLMNCLSVVPISRASAEQRKGRAGRTCAGVCYRLYTRQHFELEMAAETVPEILRTDLTQTVLLLKSIGVEDPLKFSFLDQPDNDELMQSMMKLRKLGALHLDGTREGSLCTNGLTDPVGQRMASMPLEPHMSRALIAADELGCASDLLSAFAILSTGLDLFDRRSPQEVIARFCKGKDKVLSSDHLLLARIYANWAHAGYTSSWCREHSVQWRTLSRAREVRRQLENYVSHPDESCPSAVFRALLIGFPDHVATLNRRGLYEIARYDAHSLPDHANRKQKSRATVHIHPSSCMYLRERAARRVLFHEHISTTRDFIRCVSSLDDQDVSVKAAGTSRSKAQMSRIDHQSLEREQLPRGRLHKKPLKRRP